MGFYSKVQITAQHKAFERFKTILDDEGLSYVVRSKDNADTKPEDSVKVINLDWVKWYPEFEVVRKVDALTRELRKEKNDEDGNGFKMIVLNEDDTHEECYNITGDTEFCDMSIICDIYNPYTGLQEES